VTATGILLIGSGVVVAVVALVVLHRRSKRALDALASDLGSGKLKSGVSHEAELDGQRYRYKYFEGSKNSPSYFEVSVDCPSKGEFRIGRETRWDVFFKRVGISAEIQTGDAAFDRDFYIRTDSIAFTEHFFRSAEKRRSVSRLFALNYKELTHDGASLAVRMSPFRPATHRDKLALESVVRDLALLAESPPQDYFEALVIGTPAWKLRRAGVFAVAIASGVMGFALLMWGERSFTPLDGTHLLTSSLEYSLPALLVFVISSIVLLKGRSSSHTELLTSWAIALIGFPLFGIGATLTVNGFLDPGDPTIHVAEILDKHVSGSGRSVSRRVYVRSWREGRDRERLEVGSDAYARAKVGSAMRITTKTGRLGFEWIADYQMESGGR
jgi:hypothetical protein